MDIESIFSSYNLNALDTNHWIYKKFEEFRYNIMEKEPVLGLNYSKRRFNIENQIATFVIFNNKESDICSVASVYRPKHWSKEIIRISNRYFINPKYRCKNLSLYDGYTYQYTRQTKPIGRYIQRLSYKDMILSCKNAGAKVAVVSREINILTNKTRIDSMLRTIRYSDPRWEKTEKLYLVCDNTKDPRCWQQLMYLTLYNKEDSVYLDKIDSIDRESWNSLEIKKMS